jgi:hypothetical protein
MNVKQEKGIMVMYLIIEKKNFVQINKQLNLSSSSSSNSSSRSSSSSSSSSSCSSSSRSSNYSTDFIISIPLTSAALAYSMKSNLII